MVLISLHTFFLRLLSSFLEKMEETEARKQRLSDSRLDPKA